MIGWLFYSMISTYACYIAFDSSDKWNKFDYGDVCILFVLNVFFWWFIIWFAVPFAIIRKLLNLK